MEIINVGDIVFYSGLKYLVIATKIIPFEPKIDMYNRQDIFPKNDFLIIKLIDKETANYSGIIDVYEHELLI